MRKMTLTGGLALAISSVTLIAAPVAGATTYDNNTPITFPSNLVVTDPYPSSITVSGTAGPITDVNVGLDGLTHDTPDNLRIVLVSPAGGVLLLQGCVGGTTDAAGKFVTFDSDAAAFLPDAGPLESGTFKPTRHCPGGGDVGCPAPGPAVFQNNSPGPVGTATLASAFNGQSAIGTWNLYICDGNVSEYGLIPGGWSLDVKPDVTPPPAVISTPLATPTPTSAPGPAPQKCKKKKKKKKGARAAACKKKKKK